jgi:hypothetical protein
MSDEVSPCNVYRNFPGADEIIKTAPDFIAINRGGPHGIDTASECWGTVEDPLKIQGCVLALVKFLDGSPVAIRYYKHDVLRKEPADVWIK